MYWNSAMLMPALTSTYWGMALYLSNASTQSAWLIGGRAPMIGFHSVIDRPEPVSRVAPPTTTMANTRVAQKNSHSATARLRSSSPIRFIRRLPFAPICLPPLSRAAEPRDMPLPRGKIESVSTPKRRTTF